MLQNITDYTKSQNFTLKSFNITSILKDTVSLTKFRLKQKKLTLDLKIEKNLPQIYGNADKLKQVIINLLTNAMEASLHEETISLEAKLFLDTKLDNTAHIQIVVTNVTEKIDHDNLKKCFDPFYTTKQNGLGLGLSISKDIIKQQINVLSLSEIKYLIHRVNNLELQIKKNSQISNQILNNFILENFSNSLTSLGISMIASFTVSISISSP